MQKVDYVVAKLTHDQKMANFLLAAAAAPLVFILTKVGTIENNLPQKLTLSLSVLSFSVTMIPLAVIALAAVLQENQIWHARAHSNGDDIDIAQLEKIAAEAPNLPEWFFYVVSVGFALGYLSLSGYLAISIWLPPLSDGTP